MKRTYILSVVAFMLLATSYINAQTVYQAETATVTSCTTKAETNASGSGNNVVTAFAGTVGGNGQNKVVFVQGGASGGAGTILVHYSNGDATNKTLNFYTYLSDGSTAVLGGAVTFPPTGSWSTFGDVAIPYTMTFLIGNPVGNNFKLRNDAAATVNVEIDYYTTYVTGAYVAPTSVNISPSSTTVNVGATTNLTATVSPGNATNNAVAWTTSDPAVATVSTSGVVSGVTVGSVTITATSYNGLFTSTSTITVDVPTSTKVVDKNSISIYPTVISNNVLNISNPDKGNYEVSIANASGQCVYSNKVNSGNVSINTSLLKSGLYLVRVGNLVQKVIVL